MKAIAYLKEIEALDAKINADIEELAGLEALATKTTSVMGGEKVQSSGSQQKMADCVMKIIDMKNRINDEIDRFVAHKNKARALICSCEADCINLLYKRYFQYKTWEEIAVEMGFTYKWVSGGLHAKALSQMQKVLDGQKEDEKRGIKRNKEETIP